MRNPYKIFTLCWALFILYGSLVPFDIQWLSWPEIKYHLAHIHFYPIGITGKTDFLANILLFIPLGFAAMGWCNSQSDSINPITYILFKASLLTLLGLTYSLFVESCQIFVKSRVPSYTDVTAETTGMILGITAWYTIKDKIEALLSNIQKRWGKVSLYLAVYLGFLLIYNLLPGDILVSPVDVYHKIKAGGIIIIPFTHYKSVLALIDDFVINTLFFIPVGYLLTLFYWTQKKELETIKVMLIGFAIATALEFLQLFISLFPFKT